MAELPPWAPASAAVANHLRPYARTPVSGAQQTDFDDNTLITKDDADAAIVSVTGDVIGAVGAVPEDLQDQAASVVALGAAAEAVIEHDAELHDRLQRLFESRLARLKTAVDDMRDGTLDGTPVSTPATGCFPAPFDVTRRAF